MFIIDDRDRFG